MPLFQTAVLNKYLKQQDSARMATAYAAFRAHFHDAAVQVGSQLRMVCGLRLGLSRPSGVAQPLQSVQLCAGFAPWLAARSLRLATTDHVEMASDIREAKEEQYQEGFLRDL
jgi:hypothetical protein